MLFHVRMDVNIPLDMPAEKAAEIKAVEKAYSQDLQRKGVNAHVKLHQEIRVWAPQSAPP